MYVCMYVYMFVPLYMFPHAQEQATQAGIAQATLSTPLSPTLTFPDFSHPAAMRKPCMYLCVYVYMHVCMYVCVYVIV